MDTSLVFACIVADEKPSLLHSSARKTIHYSPGTISLLNRHYLQLPPSIPCPWTPIHLLLFFLLETAFDSQIVVRQLSGYNMGTRGWIVPVHNRISDDEQRH